MTSSYVKITVILNQKLFERVGERKKVFVCLVYMQKENYVSLHVLFEDQKNICNEYIFYSMKFYKDILFRTTKINFQKIDIADSQNLQGQYNSILEQFEVHKLIYIFCLRFKYGMCFEKQFLAIILFFACYLSVKNIVQDGFKCIP